MENAPVPLKAGKWNRSYIPKTGAAWWLFSRKTMWESQGQFRAVISAVITELAREGLLKPFSIGTSGSCSIQGCPPSSRGEEECRGPRFLGRGPCFLGRDLSCCPTTVLDLSLPGFWVGFYFTSSIFEACSYLTSWLEFAETSWEKWSNRGVDGWTVKVSNLFFTGNKVKKESWCFFWELCTGSLDWCLHSWISQDKPPDNTQEEQRVVKCKIFLQQAN